MKTFLFDIDGTLLRSGGAGLHAMQIAMNNLFRIGKLAKVEVRGRTDRAIVQDLFAAHNIEDSDANWRDFQRAYHEILPLSLDQGNGGLLPGVQTALDQLAQHSDAAIGLLTGNSQVAAKIKLSHFAVDHLFAFGGFGDHRTCRNEVAHDARLAAAQHLEHRFDEKQIWVIGDTPSDVQCGRAIGAQTVGVLTGGYDRQSMEAAKPDHLLDDLREFSHVMASIC